MIRLLVVWYVCSVLYVCAYTIIGGQPPGLLYFFAYHGVRYLSSVDTYRLELKRLVYNMVEGGSVNRFFLNTG